MDRTKAQTVGVVIPADLLAKIDRAAKREGRSRSNWIRHLITRHFDGS